MKCLPSEILEVSLALVAFCMGMITVLNKWLDHKFQCIYNSLIEQLNQKYEAHRRAREYEKKEKLKELLEVAILLRIGDDIFNCSIYFFIAMFLFLIVFGMVILQMFPVVSSPFLPFVVSSIWVFGVGAFLFLSIALYDSFVLVFRLKRL